MFLFNILISNFDSYKVITGVCVLYSLIIWVNKMSTHSIQTGTKKKKDTNVTL